MDILKGWIGPRVYQALTEALKWKAQGSPPTEHDGQEFKFEDDGNSLRVRSSKREYVQISKIEEYTRPIQLWLSDSKTFLKVVISASAAERFEREEERRVTEGTLGAVIQILDYEIVAQHHGPKRTKITMLINNFKHIGSDGSTFFGTPCSIDCLPPIIEVLEKLQTFRAQEHQPSQPRSDQISSLSQTNSISSADDNTDRSQAMFATQVPQLQSRKRLREGSLKPNSGQPRVLESSDSVRLEDILPGGNNIDHGLNPSFAPANRGKEVSRTNAGQAVSKQAKSHDQVTAQIQDVHHDRPQEESEAENLGVVQDSAAKRTHDLLSLLARNSNKAKSDHVNEQAIVRPVALAKQSPQDQVPSPPASAEESLLKDSELQRITSATVRDSECSSDRPKSPIKSSRVTKPTPGPLKAPQDPNSPARQLRKVPTRISGREVRISKVQRDLLERAESWYPPEPGRRVPTANIPILVLQELNNGAEQKAGLNHRSSQTSNISEGSESEENNQKGSDSDEPIPSAEWPSSPPEQVVLPPDSVSSSAKSPEQNISKHDSASDFDLNVISSIEKDYTTLERRFSSVSPPSSSDMSPRRNIPRAARPKKSSTNGASPSPFSTQVRSPLSDQFGRRNSLRSAKRFDRSNDHPSKAASLLQSRSSQSRRNSTSASNSPAQSLRGLTRQEILDDMGSIAKERSRLINQNDTADLTKVNRFSEADRTSQINLSEKSSENTDIIQSEMLTDRHFEMSQSTPYDNNPENLNSLNAASRISELRQVAFNDATLRLSSHFNEKVDGWTQSSETSNLIKSSLTAQTSPKEKWPGILSLESIQDADTQTGPRNDAISSDTESDLETCIPHGLDNTKDIPSTIPSTQDVIVTAAQPQDPILQVNRTPYPTKRSIELPLSSAFPTKAKGGLSHSTTLNVINVESSQVPTATTRSESAGEVINRHAVDRHYNTFQGDDIGKGGSLKPSEAKGPLAVNHEGSMVDTPISSVEETMISAPNSENFPKSSENSVLPPSVEVRSKIDMKRKASEPVILSPNVTKRRKVFDKGRAASEIVARNQIPDPADIIGFRNRDDFFKALRKSSNAQTKIEGTGAGSDLNTTNSFLNASPRHLRESLSEKQNGLVAAGIPSTLNAQNEKLQFPESYHSTTGQQSTPAESSACAQPIDIVNETRFDDTTADDPKQSTLSTRDETRFGANGLPSVQVCSTAVSLEAQDATKALHAPLTEPLKNTVSKGTSHTENSIHHESKPKITEGENEYEITMKMVPDIAQATEKPEPDLNGSTKRVPQPNQEANEVEAPLPPPNQPLSIFERFKTTFPSYTGNSVQFAAICKRIGILFRADNMEHPSLWDDFIIRHRLEYPHYLSRCNDEAVDPMPYERFYRNEVQQAKYISPNGPIVTRNSILEYIPSESPANSRSEGSVVALSAHHRHNGWPLLDLTGYRAQLAESKETSAVQSPAISGRAMSRDVNVDIETSLEGDAETQSCCRICQQPGTANMISCANSQCKHMPFHKACVGLKETSASESFCSKCRQDGNLGHNRHLGKEDKHENRQAPVSDSTRTSTTAHEQEASASAVRVKGLLRTQSSSSVMPFGPTEIADFSNGRKPQTKKEIIDLSSSSEVEEVQDKMTLVREVPKAKQARRSLPWQSPGHDSNGRAPAVQITASSLASPAPTPRGVPKTSAFRNARLRSSAAAPPSDISPATGKAKPTPATASSRPKSQDAATVKVTLTNHSSPINDAKAKSGRSPNPIGLSNDPHSPYNAFLRNYSVIVPGKGNSYAEEGQSQRKSSGKKKQRHVNPFDWEI